MRRRPQVRLAVSFSAESAVVMRSLHSSLVSFGFGAGGGDYGKTEPSHFGGGAGAGVKVDPVAFLVVKDGLTRVMPVAIPAAATVDRVLDLVPEVLDRVQNFVDKKREEKDIY